MLISEIQRRRPLGEQSDSEGFFGFQVNFPVEPHQAKPAMEALKEAGFDPHYHKGHVGVAVFEMKEVTTVGRLVFEGRLGLVMFAELDIVDEEPFRLALRALKIGIARYVEHGPAGGNPLFEVGPIASLRQLIGLAQLYWHGEAQSPGSVINM